MVEDIKGCGFVFKGTKEPIWWLNGDNVWKVSKTNEPWVGEDYYCGAGNRPNTWLCVSCAQKFGIQW